LPQIKKKLSRIREFFSDIIDIPSSNLSPEKEEEIINKLARLVSRWDMEIPALTMGRMFVPTSSVISQTVMIPSALYLDLMGIDGFEVAAFFNKKENVKRLLAKIQELKDAKEYD